MIEDTRDTFPHRIPIYIAQKCPVCNGFGSVNYGKMICHACKGKGYILVPNFSEGGEPI